MTSKGQALFFNTQKPGRTETEHIPDPMSLPATFHGEGLPERGEHMLTPSDSSQTLIRRQEAFLIIKG